MKESTGEEPMGRIADQLQQVIDQQRARHERIAADRQQRISEAWQLLEQAKRLQDDMEASDWLD